MAGVCAGLVSCQQEAPRQPNIVFVLLDDLAYDALENSERYPFLETPNINALQEEGVTFDNFFCTMSLSSPSRASFLTGMYAHKHGANQNDERVDPDWESYPSYNELLQDAGYETAFIGKLHNAQLWGKDQVRPGYDYWLGFRGQGDYFDPQLNENGREFKAEGYMTDILTDYAEDWIRTKRDKKKPFSLCLWHKAVHEPYWAAPRHKGMYSQDSLPLPPNGNGVETFEGKPEWQKYKKTYYTIWENDPEWNPHYKTPLMILETLRAVDESLGRIVQTLKDEGLWENTVILFAGDNGYFMGEHGFWDKRIAYEECMRIPMIMCYPKMIEKGTDITQMCLNIDIAPTLLELAGVEVPEYMQGMSIVPLLEQDTAHWREDFLFEYFVDDAYPYAGPTQLAVRTEDFKLVDADLEDDIDELYDLKNDPGEMHNLINHPDYQEKVKEMRDRLERLKKETEYNPDRDFWLREQAPKWVNKEEQQ